MPKTIDCFLFRDEFALLELRLRYLWEVVDAFVLVYASHTHQGEPLDDVFQSLPPQLEAFREKLHPYRVALPLDAGLDSWGREQVQRNASISAVARLAPGSDDLVILSDVDEIWFYHVAAQLHQALRDGEFPECGRAQLPGWLSYYFANVIQDEPWRYPFAMSWEHFHKSDPFTLRTSPGSSPLSAMSSWHMSYAGGVDAILSKLNSFAHTEFQGTKYVQRDWVARCLKDLKDPYERNIEWREVGYQELAERMEPKLLDLLLGQYPQFLTENVHNEYAALSQKRSSSTVR